MDAIRWLEQNRQYFSREMNGYKDIPIGPYLSTLPLIDRDGKVMDLGSGNGMLLKFLMDFSGHNLNPFGVDINGLAIQQATQEVLPGFAEQFYIEDVNSHKFQDGPFSIIITNPFYSKPNMREFTERCLDNLCSGGRLLYRIHNDVLEAYNINSLEKLPDFKNLGMRVSNGYGLSFCTFDK